MVNKEKSAREAKRRLLQILHKNRFRRNPNPEEKEEETSKEKEKREDNN